MRGLQGEHVTNERAARGACDQCPPFHILCCLPQVAFFFADAETMEVQRSAVVNATSLRVGAQPMALPHRHKLQVRGQGIGKCMEAIRAVSVLPEYDTAALPLHNPPTSHEPFCMLLPLLLLPVLLLLHFAAAPLLLLQALCGRDSLDEDSWVFLLGSMALTKAYEDYVHVRLSPPPGPNLLEYPPQHQLLVLAPKEERHAGYRARYEV